MKLTKNIFVQTASTTRCLKKPVQQNLNALTVSLALAVKIH